MLSGIPILFRLQFPYQDPIPDADASYLVDYRITAGFRSGVLTLLSMGGPVAWTANYACFKGSQFQQTEQASPDELRAQRRDANLEAIQGILSGTTPGEQEPEYLRAVSAAWQQIAAAIRP